MREIHSLNELSAHLGKTQSLKDTVIQSVDLSTVRNEVLAATIDNTVFLGCVLPDEVLASVVNQGAQVFPKLKGLPFNPYQPILYNAQTLFDGFDERDPCSYCNTSDARIYQHLSLIHI